MLLFFQSFYGFICNPFIDTLSESVEMMSGIVGKIKQFGRNIKMLNRFL